MSVRRFYLSDTDECKHLWKISFPGDEEFCEFYFSKVISLADSFVYVHEGVVAGYLASIPFYADSGNHHNIPVRYLYGISVLPKFRGMGFMKELMQAESNEFSCPKLLIPSVDNLYEKFGFSYLTHKKTENIENNMGNAKKTDDFRFLNEIYDCYRSRFDFSLSRSKVWWDIIIEDAKNFGWHIVVNDGAYAVIKGNSIKEFAYVSEFYRDTLNIGKAQLSLPDCMGNFTLSGAAYISMMLD